MTSIEWLYNNLFPKKLDGFSDDKWEKIDDAFKQAKEIHKQEMEKTFDDAIESEILKKKITAEEYYNETFKKD